MEEGFFHSFDGTRIYYNSTGRGLPLVCCDGIACDQYAWKYVHRWFSPTQRVVRWNYRGHGKSDAPADFSHLTIADLADDLHRLFDELKLDRGVLLNVNVPAGAAGSLRGLYLATQSAQSGNEQFEEQRSPRGRRYFWNIYREPNRDVQGTDVWAVSQGYVAVTPLRVGEFDAKTYAAMRDLR